MILPYIRVIKTRPSQQLQGVQTIFPKNKILFGPLQTEQPHFS